MTTESANCCVLVEMRTHHFTFQGTGIESRFRISYQEMGADACYPAISPGTGARP
ncbi:hypothetical protein HAP93_02685 [Acidithiobacillus ferriphilus]|jgi:hypothetical protein|uniref:hypothetical protein n=1 Tax=Acidithiobacillus ferriphilus TaxID=1689834 RepID=UPI001C062681|nr:hypothetical protein [Acidithiobacillus ferriphilus]MBU2784683.1 hypothetical protein [Acidithiobacillus ferriphilus]MBU2828671.1 hypothetical protein [Acidithiobacillus ferriphilus]MBU2848003.1 hypothetical protein [Acidithiobacillus ferriphilus]MEB8474736.1 hypothetical protein [Acidithiobacillus ferriphilus]MEB8534619.1 hypothetical protein [Acidithiobacillus ferriphilus]